MLTQHQDWSVAEESSPALYGDFAELIEALIERRASGQIRDLRVECQDEMIVIKGRSRTYHAKQLAQQAVLDLPEVTHHCLANQIVVC
jgi:hypothetical protein